MRRKAGIRVPSVLPFLILLCFSPAFAQQPLQSAPEMVDVSRSSLERARQRITRNEALDPADKERILTLYDEALDAELTAARFSAQATRFELDERTAPGLIRSLEAVLRGSPAEVEVSLPDSATSVQLDQQLRKARSELSARRDAVRALQVSAQQRAERRIEIARRAGLLEQEIFDFDTSLETVAESVNEPLLRDATIASLASRKQAALAEGRALNAELTNYDARQPLTSLQEKRADRRVNQAVQRISQLERILARKSAAETAEYRAELQEDCGRAVESYPNLQGLTAEIRQLVDMLPGPGSG